jgi:uncharacterized membrane protein YbaN (DUF454 family)
MSEPLNSKHTNEDKELIDMWQANTMPGMGDPSQLARNIAGKVNQFDRTIFWRNFREYAAGAVLFVVFGFQLFDAEHRTTALAGLAAVGFVLIYMWNQHRRVRPLDPAADARTYHSELLKRYDDQIKLLRTVKYWYVLPIYAYLLVVLARVPLSLPGHIIPFVIVTAFGVFVIWLNEGYGVRKLKDDKAKAESLFEEQAGEGFGESK